MDIRNRMADVVKLRCNACQDYFRMILEDNWKQELYDTAKNALKDSHHRSKYIATYEKMRDIGVDNYRVEDMDITLMAELAEARKYNKFFGIRSIKEKTLEALKQIREDRNLTNHSGENEEPDELYLRGLLALCDIRSFVKAVDKEEKSIEDEQRFSYRRKYFDAIRDLMSIIDNERIEIIQREKEIELDIRKIQESDAPLYEYVATYRYYIDRYQRRDDNPKKVYDFLIKASDSGISYADMAAIGAVISMKDYEEADRRLLRYLNSNRQMDRNKCQAVLNHINQYMKQEPGMDLTDGMKKAILILEERGCNIEKKDNGRYEISRIKPFIETQSS